MGESATVVSTARAPTVKDVAADSLATAKPEGPDLRRVSDSKGENVGCAGWAGVDEVTDPPRAASVLTTLRGGACEAPGRGEGAPDAAARDGASEGRDAPVTPPGIGPPGS